MDVFAADAEPDVAALRAAVSGKFRHLRLQLEPDRDSDAIG
jgi:hypothetical protein